MWPPWIVVLGTGAALLSLLSHVAAQSFPIPPTWRKPSSNLTRDDRLSLVEGLLNTVAPMYNDGSGQFNNLFLPQSGSLLCALSIGDRINGSNRNQDMVMKSLNKVFTTAPTIITLPGSGLNSDAVMWGLAAINAYRTYKDPQALQYARSMWSQVNTWVVTPDNSAAGKHPLKDPGISPTCAGGSSAGAVFYVANNASDTNVNAETTAGFMTLSALLYELTQETPFLSAAELSAQFVIGPLNTGNIIRDTVTLQNCTPSITSLSYNSGHAIHGLSVLGSINDTYASIGSRLVSTVIPNTEWTDQQSGIINEGAADITNNAFTLSVKTIYVRGLYEAYTRIPPDSAEAALIRSHLLVQYNALQDMASAPQSNQYNPHFMGPPSTTLLPWGQLAAADTLYSALNLTDNFSSTGTAGTTTASGSSSAPTASVSPAGTALPPNGSSHHGIPVALIGGIVAGLVLLIILVVVIIIVRRRRQRHARFASLEEAVQQRASLGDQAQMAEVPQASDVKYTYRPSVDGAQRPVSTHSSIPPSTPGSIRSEPPDYIPGSSRSSSTPGSSVSGPPDYVTNEDDEQDRESENPFSDIHSESTSSAGGAQRRVDLTSLQRLVQHINRLVESEQNNRRLPSGPPPDYEE